MIEQLVDKYEMGRAQARLFGRLLNQKYYNKFHGERYNQRGVNVLQQDWDNLIILDGCRYDTFCDHNSLPGELSSKTSRGSQTSEFIKGNFSNKSIHDTIYIVANPMFSKHKNNLDIDFYDVIDLWDSKWNQDAGTVLPSEVTKSVLEIFESNPNKRIIAHYLQPHYPFLDDDSGISRVPERGDYDIWNQLLRNELAADEEDIYELYVQNLKTVIPYVYELLQELPGKSVVTSDHGNMFGEPSNPIPTLEYGHPGGLYTPELVKIPWLEYEKDNRRSINPENPIQHSESNYDSVEKKLSSLGYK